MDAPEGMGHRGMVGGTSAILFHKASEWKSDCIILPHSAPTWILNPSWALLRARVGFKITFYQTPNHQPTLLMDLISFNFQWCAVFPRQLFPLLTKNVRCAPPSKSQYMFLPHTNCSLYQESMCFVPPSSVRCPPPLPAKLVWLLVYLLPYFLTC